MTHILVKTTKVNMTLIINNRPIDAVYTIEMAVIGHYEKQLGFSADLNLVVEKLSQFTNLIKDKVIEFNYICIQINDFIKQQSSSLKISYIKVSTDLFSITYNADQTLNFSCHNSVYFTDSKSLVKLQLEFKQMPKTLNFNEDFNLKQFDSLSELCLFAKQNQATKLVIDNGYQKQEIII